MSAVAAVAEPARQHPQPRRLTIADQLAAMQVDAEWYGLEFGLPLVIVDRDQRIHRATAGVYQQTGLPAGSLVDEENPRYLTDPELMSPEAAASHGAHFGEVFVGRGDKPRRYSLCCAMLQTAEGPKPVRIIGIEPPAGVADDLVIGQIVPQPVWDALEAVGLAPGPRGGG